MAVYTHVSESELRAALQDYDVGELGAFRGIAEGVENTNYAVETDGGRFILTLFERRVREGDLPFFLELMGHLAKKGLPSPAPVPGKDGEALRRICGKPAVLITFLPGAPRMTPSAPDCRALGHILAKLHLATADFPFSRRNDLGLPGWIDLAVKCEKRADDHANGLSAFIRDEIEFVRSRWPLGLPSGVIHADLFPDNVFFESGAVTGMIDFYFSCTDYYAYDLAVCLISWAFVSGSWRANNAAALIAGYEAGRLLSRAERDALPILARGAALRFLLTRLYDALNLVEGAVVRVKNPLEYRDLLRLLRESPYLIGHAHD
ncbi:MAG: homoserine kinase [Parvularculaceae bacterium]